MKNSKINQTITFKTFRLYVAMHTQWLFLMKAHCMLGVQTHTVNLVLGTRPILWLLPGLLQIRAGNSAEWCTYILYVDVPCGRILIQTWKINIWFKDHAQFLHHVISPTKGKGKEGKMPHVVLNGIFLFDVQYD